MFGVSLSTVAANHFYPGKLTVRARQDDGQDGMITFDQLSVFLAPEDTSRDEHEGEDVLERVADAMRVAAYRTDWSALFSKFDTDGNGTLDFAEFLRAIRMSIKIPESQVTDEELLHLFTCIDDDGEGDIDAIEFREFLWLDNLKRQLRRASEKRSWEEVFAEIDEVRGPLLPHLPVYP
jgi:Ca2+-binding EF-hand superfamily protein